MIKVLIADDHAVVRRGLKEILEDAHGMIAAGEASNGYEVLQAVRQNHYDVIVLDIAMPDMDGLEVLKQIRSLQPELPVLMLSIYPEEQFALRAFKAGALGYLTKECAPEELVDAIHTVAQRRLYINRVLLENAIGDLGMSAEKTSHEIFSDREFQVVSLLGAGNTVSEIAEELSLSVKTISTYRARILEKLGAKNTAEIIRYAFENEIIK